MRSLRRDEVREIDRRAIEEVGLPGIVLMENAGRGAAELLHAIAPRGTPLAPVPSRASTIHSAPARASSHASRVAAASRVVGMPAFSA
ncbi:MAG: hypothetical protein ACKONH_09765, partial [Planctomycetia bacterium]